MEQKNRCHALEIRTEICVGCSHCMRVCPTEALRVVGGKAMVFSDWCVDCGECYRVCPSRAIRITDDDINRIFNYKYRILLIPAVFLGQFPTKISLEEINDYLCEMGFTEVCAVEQSADLLQSALTEYVETHPKPVISSFCPAVIRLIQVRFPMLVNQIMQLPPPLEVTALYYKHSFEAKGIPPEELGIFYVTPCAAKIASVKAPVGGYVSPINGVINMNHLFNKIYLAYKNKKLKLGTDTSVKTNAAISATGIRWPMTGGEASHIKGRALAIDGMANVIEFLEKLENDEIKGIDFLELRACDESCAGGILMRGNRFLAVERLKEIAASAPQEHVLAADYGKLCSPHINMQPVEPRSMVKFDVNIKIAIEKMSKARQLRELLPGIDCGACGTPSCEALAEDIVCRDAQLHSCIFMRLRSKKKGAILQESGMEIMEKIWGKERFSDEIDEIH